MAFPAVPFDKFDSERPKFVPCPDVREWAYGSFIDKDADLLNEHHKHLRHAKILFLWASYTERAQGRGVAGTAEFFQPKQGRWRDGTRLYQVTEWNEGRVPDFIVILNAPYCQEAAPESICALVEHELYHCGQARDEFGFPKFTRDGLPKFAIRAHDVEEFVGVVARYGAVGNNVAAMVEAGSRPPTIKRNVSKNAVCGCGAAV